MLDQGKADTHVQRKTAASRIGSKTRKSQLGPTCVSTSLLPFLKKEVRSFQATRLESTWWSVLRGQSSGVLSAAAGRGDSEAG